MHVWLINMIAGCLLGALLAGILIPQILLIAFRKKLFDEPNARKIHRIAVPRLGGMAFTPVLFFTIAFLLGVNLYFGQRDILIDMDRGVMQLAFGLCSITAMYLIGIADDLIGVRYRAKFIVQILCGTMLVGSTLWIHSLNGFLGVNEMPLWLGGMLSVIVIVFIVNAINLIDGVDGLASGLSTVAFFYYAIVFYQLEHYTYCLVACTMVGILVPFFYYNVFGNATKSTKIFMGDTGSLTIGVVLSMMSLKVTTISPIYVFAPADNLVVAFAPLMVPCFDVIRVFGERIAHGHNPFLPDKTHIHHKILALGFSTRLTMVSIVIGSLLFTVGNVLLSHLINTHILFLFDVLFYVGLCVLLTKLANKRNQKLENKIE